MPALYSYQRSAASAMSSAARSLAQSPGWPLPGKVRHPDNGVSRQWDLGIRCKPAQRRLLLSSFHWFSVDPARMDQLRVLLAGTL